MKADSQLFTIQQVSTRFGVSKSTLRFWEKKFRAHISPDRSKGGQRRYSAEHAAVIATIQRLKSDGLSLDEIDARLSLQRPGGATEPALSLEVLAERIAAMVKLEVSRYFASAAPAEGQLPSRMRAE
jgi:DNA-binding transcriptional MerR regulator